MTTLCKYRIYCNTEDIWVEKWDTASITVCPNNNGHTVNINSIQELDCISENTVAIKEESTNTGGFFCASTVILDIPSGATGATTVINHSLPFNRSNLVAKIKTNSTAIGDKLDFLVNPNTTLGTITSNVVSGTATLPVSQTVMDNLQIGFFVNVTDGTINNDLGRCIDKNTESNTIVTEYNTANGFTASTPTYVQMTLKIIHDYEIGEPGDYEIGSSKIGGSYVPKSTMMKIIYTNNNGQAKRLPVHYEFLY